MIISPHKNIQKVKALFDLIVLSLIQILNGCLFFFRSPDKPRDNMEHLQTFLTDP